MIINELDSDKLNIVEGGSAYYLFYFRNKIKPGDRWQNSIDRRLVDIYKEYEIKSIVFYYDTVSDIESIAQRSREMLLYGAIDEVWAFNQLMKSRDVNESYLTPIGYAEISTLLRSYKRSLSAQDKAKLIHDCYKGLNTQTRRYSKTQYKYLKKYFSSDGDFWVHAKEDNLSIQDVLSTTERRQKKLPNFNALARTSQDKSYKDIDKITSKKLSEVDMNIIIEQLDRII